MNVAGLLAAAGLVVFGAAVVRSQQAPPAGPPAPAGEASSPGRAGRQGGRGAGPLAAAPIDPEAVARGVQIYTVNCTTCHGANGRGGNENRSDLTQSTLTAGTDGGTQLGEFLKVGRPERRMPPFQLTDAQVSDLFAFLRSLVTPAASRGGGRGGITALVVGDATAGQTTFNTMGCAGCHSVTGDLKGIGARLPVATIQGRVVVPRGNGGYPPGFSQPPNPNETPRTVTVTQASGEKIAGTLMWITDFNVTLVDADGIQRTFARNGDLPAVEMKDPLQWHLDHMRTMTDKEMHDLTAYLVTLK